MQRTRLVLGGCLAVLAGCFCLWAWKSDDALAHCDTLDGPVVKEAMDALEKGEVEPLLKWVPKAHEAEIRAAFRSTLLVRSKGPEAKALADLYFFETLVRIHRAGEGAPYTGLKGAGEIAPPVAAADKAVETGQVDALAEKVGAAATAGIKKRFARLLEAKKHKDDSVEAGREYVEAYVTFVHFVEGLHEMIASSGAHHGHGEGK